MRRLNGPARDGTARNRALHVGLPARVPKPASKRCVTRAQQPERKTARVSTGPHTCAIGTHVMLEQTGKPSEAVKIDVHGGATRQK